MSDANTGSLSGHLKEYPLSDVLGILRHRRTTGRLFIDYPAAPGVLFFKDGEPVEAQVGFLKGARAVELATSLPDSPFNFDPQIGPSLKPADWELRKAVLELIGCAESEPPRRAGAKGEAPDEESGDTEESAADVTLFARRVLPGEGTTPLPVSTSRPGRAGRHKRVLIFAGALLTLGVVAPIAAFTDVFDGGPDPAPAAVERAGPVETKGGAPDTREIFMGEYGLAPPTQGGGRPSGVVERREKAGQPQRAPSQNRAGAEAATRPAPTAPATPDEGGTEPPRANRAPNAGESAVTVVTRVENGRVVEAYVANRRPGMEAFEASALRAARQRRFSPGTTGSEQVQIKVGQQ